MADLVRALKEVLEVEVRTGVAYTPISSPVLDQGNTGTTLEEVKLATITDIEVLFVTRNSGGAAQSWRNYHRYQQNPRFDFLVNFFQSCSQPVWRF
jgi:hypothetical protein